MARLLAVLALASFAALRAPSAGGFPRAFAQDPAAPGAAQGVRPADPRRLADPGPVGVEGREGAAEPFSLPLSEAGLDPLPEDSGIFPIYSDWVDRETGERRIWAGLFYYQHSLGFEGDGSRPLLEGAGAQRYRFRTFFPLFWSKQNRDRYFTTFLPFYWSWGEMADWQSTFFPLYWRGHTDLPGDPRGDGHAVLFPFYWDLYEPGARDLVVLPFYMRFESPGADSWWFLFPLYGYSSYTNLTGDSAGSGHSVLFPMFEYTRREEGHTFRLLPFYAESEYTDSESLLVTPFFYRSSAPTGSLLWIFPFYGRWEGHFETIDNYAAGIYGRRRVVDEANEVTRSGDHWLWGLVSFERDEQARFEHEHFLPLGYWYTETEDETMTVGGPLFFSRRYRDFENKIHALDLVLGNLYFSSRVELPAGRPSFTSARVETADGSPADTGAVDGVADAPATPRDEAPGASASEDRDATARLESLPQPWVQSSDQGVLWPLSRWYHDDTGNEGRWVAPFYFDTRSASSEKLAIWPFSYQQEDETSYELNYFRYFFLLNHESWSGGNRLTIGQLLFDWSSESATQREHISALYPLFEIDRSEDHFEVHVDQIIAAQSSEEAGERKREYRFFPFFWLGKRERLSASGDWVPQEKHFYLFPFYGFEARTTKVDHHVLYPLFHIQQATESTRVELWPIAFYAKNPTLSSWSLWPLHAHQSGEGADDDWVRRFLFLSKYSGGPGRVAYRLDPFLWSYESHEQTASSELSFLFSIYRSRTEGGETRRTLLWFIDF